MRRVLFIVLTLCFIADAPAFGRDWDQVPGLRAFIEGAPLNLTLPAEQGGAKVSVVLGQNAPAKLPFENFGATRWEMARIDFREEGYRQSFRVYSLTGANAPVRAMLADGDWVEILDLRIGPVVGLVMEADQSSVLDHFELHTTQYDGLWCLTSKEGLRWLVRLDTNQTGTRFPLWTFFDIRLEFVLGKTPAERSEVFRRQTLSLLSQYLRPRGADAGFDVVRLNQMYALGEYVNAHEPAKWRREFVAVLNEQLKEISDSWGKLQLKKSQALQQLAGQLAAASPDQPLPIEGFEAAWSGTLQPGTTAGKPSTGQTSAAGSASTPSPANQTSATQSPAKQSSSPQATASQSAPPPNLPTSATHPLEAEFWAEFKARPPAGLTVAQARPYAEALAAGPQKSELFSYLSKAMLAVTRPAESPYFGANAREHVGKLVSALRPLEKPVPSREEVIAGLQAFDTFYQTHTAPLNLKRAGAELLATPLATMHAAQLVRYSGTQPDFVQRWSKPISVLLEEYAGNAAKKELYATASGLYFYAHWIISPPGATVEPMRYTDSVWKGTLSPLQAARKNAAYAAWSYFWPLLDPKSAETKPLVDLFNRDPVLARSNLVSVLGLVPGDAATFAAKYSIDGGASEADYVRVAGDPVLWMRSSAPRAGEPAVWPIAEAPDLKSVRKKMLEARAALNKEYARYQESRRFWSLDDAKQRLAEFDGSSARATGPTPQVDSSQRGLDDARAAYDKDLRDGVYVGRSLNRADTVYTRELSSMERRSREFELEIMQRQVEEQRREAERQQQEAIAQSNYRNQLTDEIFEREKIVDTRGHLAKVAELKKDVGYYERRYADLLKQGNRGADSGLSAESMARAQFLRASSKESIAERYADLAKKANTSKSVDDQLEMAWYAWLMDYPETREGVGRKTFYGTKEAEEEGEDRKQRGKPLADFAEVLLEPLAATGPSQFLSGLPATLHPRQTPSAAWRTNQVEGLLNDAWFRFAHDPYAMRDHIFHVVKALRAVLGSDPLTVDALRPWLHRFQSLAPAETQKVALTWDKEPQASLLILRGLNR